MSNLPQVFKSGELPATLPSTVVEQSMNAEVLTTRPPLALLGDVKISRYGAIGLIILDTAPENRLHYPTWNEGFAVEADDIDPCLELKIPRKPFAEESRMYGTRFGLKIVRHAILPQRLLEVLSTNKWIGPAVLKQALEDGVTPPEFMEEQTPPAAAFMTTKVETSAEASLQVFRAKAAYLNALFEGLDGTHLETDHLGDEYSISWSAISGFPKNHYSYISFHPWSLFGGVSAETPGMVEKMLTNIDDLIRAFVDKDGTLEDQIRAELTADTAYLKAARLAIEASSSDTDN